MANRAVRRVDAGHHLRLAAAGFTHLPYRHSDVRQATHFAGAAALAEVCRLEFRRARYLERGTRRAAFHPGSASATDAGVLDRSGPAAPDRLYPARYYHV